MELYIKLEIVFGIPVSTRLAPILFAILFPVDETPQK
jgi:hypothetical protein